MKKTIFVAFAAIVFASVGPMSASAATMHTANITTGNQSWSSVGLTFDVNPPGIVVLELGVYDHASDGITGGATLSAVIFDATPTPLVQMDFTAGDPGTFDVASNYRFKPLGVPLVLAPGRYTIAGYGFDIGGNLEHNSNVSGPGPSFDNGGGLISFYQSVWTSSGSATPPTFPTQTYGSSFPDYFDGANMRFEALCPDPALEKEITEGPDVDADGETDVVVEVDKLTTTSYCFAINYSNPSGPDVLILDTVPAEWIVESADTSSGSRTVKYYQASSGGDKGATKIEWRPDPALGCDSLIVCVTTRQSPGKKNVKYAPTSCGMLCLNNGAEAYELDGEGEPLDQPPIMVSDALCLVAVKDLNGGGIVGDGSGDEDEDGLTDWDEVMNVGTEPCNPDTDGDGLTDGAEVAGGTDPLDNDTDNDSVLDGADEAPLDPCVPNPCP